MQTIRDAYISVELKPQVLDSLCSSLEAQLANQGIECERASQATHVSIAYTEGEVELGEARAMAERIACDSFELRAKGFEVLEGRTTDFNYLVMTLEPAGDFQNAVDVVNRCVSTRRFEEGFKSHVSLIRFKKDGDSKARAERLARVLNSMGATAMRCPQIEGECVCVYTPDREICFQVQFNRDSFPSRSHSAGRRAA